MKKILILMMVMVLTCGAVAEEQGFLNVITGRPAAKIFLCWRVGWE